jgi:hypothetical protein
VLNYFIGKVSGLSSFNFYVISAIYFIQGWASASEAESLYFGLATRSLEIKSFTSSETI